MVLRSSALRVMTAGILAAAVCWATGATAAEPDNDAAPKKNTAQTWLHRLGKFRVPDDNERNHPDVRAAFRELTDAASHSTVRILCDGVQSALGAIVRADGLIVSKASELTEHVECYLADGRRMDAQIVARDPATDLALLKIPATDLPVVQWSNDDLPRVGSLLATAGLDGTPASIGVVSAAAHAVPQPRPVLGVLLENSPKGPRIERIVARSPAAKAGLQVGDVVLRIEEKKLTDRDELIAAIESHEAGEQVKLAVLRNRESLTISAVLADLSHVGNPEQAELMDSLGGPLSKRRFGFPSVVQHDSVIRPRDCGGPVVGLDGKVVGINIARASRVASYAIPASTVRPALDKLFEKYASLTHEKTDLAPVSIAPETNGSR